jgi:tetratricopeptide (TPR) repeat protein
MVLCRTLSLGCWSLLLIWSTLSLGQDVPESPLRSRIAQLINLLGSPEFPVREQAHEELSVLGFDAIDELIVGSQHPDPEVATRCRQLIQSVDVDWNLASLPGTLVEELTDYDSKTVLDRRYTIERIGGLGERQRFDVLCRIVRFEMSGQLSRYAALTVLDQPPPSGADADEEINRLTRVLGPSARPGATWIRAWLIAHAEPLAAQARLDDLIDTERQLLASDPSVTSLETVLRLLSFEESLWRRADRIDEALATVEEMVELEGPQGANFSRLIRELIDRERWAQVDENLDRLPPEAQRDAETLYLMAEARLRAGRLDEAERLAERAFRLDPRDRTAHFLRAQDLTERNLLEWSRREAEHVRTLGFGPELSLARPGDFPKVAEILTDYPGGTIDDRKLALAELVRLDREYHEPALLRIVRFDPSEELAGLAAGWILFLEDPVDALAWPDRAARITRALRAEERRPATWLMSYAESRKQPDESLAEIAQAVAEQQGLLSDPAQANYLATAGLLRIQALLLEEQGRTEELPAVFDQLARLGPVPGPVYESLRLELAPVCRQADLMWHARDYKALAGLARRSPVEVETWPFFKYLMAGMHEAQGRFDLASQYVEEARARSPGDYFRHRQLAFLLWHRGLNEFAEGEFQYVVDLGPAAGYYATDAKSWLASMLHERGNSKDAARLMEEVVVVYQDRSDEIFRQQGRHHEGLLEDIGEYTAKQLFYQAMDAGKRGEMDRKRDLLKESLAKYPDDVDTLIELYQIPNDSETHAVAAEAVGQAIEKLQQLAQANREEPQYPNNYAWLVCNTFGDLDSALSESLRSLELQPGTASYLDTLAHVHMARGNVARAVEVQRMAVRKEPFRTPLVEKLELFEQELERQNGPMSLTPGE